LYEAWHQVGLIRFWLLVRLFAVALHGLKMRLSPAAQNRGRLLRVSSMHKEEKDYPLQMQSGDRVSQ
jgi:hypothetical protein